MIMDLAIQSLIQRISPPPYRLEGSCQKRGNCCHYIFLEWPPVLDKYPWLGRFWLWWFTDVHGFYLRDFSVENEDNRVARVMSCRHLQPDGSCGNYALRPAICRQWPRVLFTRKPYILKGCGYKAVPRDDEPPSEPPPS
jgi:Fe-S-cluster containining protein